MNVFEHRYLTYADKYSNSMTQELFDYSLIDDYIGRIVSLNRSNNMNYAYMNALMIYYLCSHEYGFKYKLPRDKSCLDTIFDIIKPYNRQRIESLSNKFHPSTFKVLCSVGKMSTFIDKIFYPVIEDMLKNSPLEDYISIISFIYNVCDMVNGLDPSTIDECNNVIFAALNERSFEKHIIVSKLFECLMNVNEISGKLYFSKPSEDMLFKKVQTLYKTEEQKKLFIEWYIESKWNIPRDLAKRLQEEINQNESSEKGN